MLLNYVKNATEDTADIFLFNQIGGLGGVNASDFVAELKYLDTLGLKEINVRINSGGGSVMEGYGIFSAIRAAKTPVNTYIEGIAASIAGIIAMAGKNRNINDFGRLMIHDPSFGTARPNNKQQKALDTIKQSLITVLANNSSLDEKEIAELMTEETWFNADEALAFGFVDMVHSTKRKKEMANELTVVDIQNIANELHLINNVEQTINTMLDLKNHLSLNEDATEGEVLEAVKGLENTITEKENTITDLTNKLEEANKLAEEKETANNEAIVALNDANTALNLEVATLVVENAIKAGKFNEAKKDELVETAIKDLNAFKNIIDSVTVAPVSITNLIETEKEITNEKNWDYYTKREPKVLASMLRNDVETYTRLYKDKFGVEPIITK